MRSEGLWGMLYNVVSYEQDIVEWDVSCYGATDVSNFEMMTTVSPVIFRLLTDLKLRLKTRFWS